jgi:outer membrane lipoprotein-sorting protein
MLRLAFTGALAALLLTGSRSFAAEDKNARAIIDRAIAAQGGEANLEKNSAVTAKFKGKFHSPAGDGTMTGTIHSQQPDKLRFEMKLNAGGGEFTILSVIDGGKGWFSFDGSAQEMDKEMMAEAREQIHAGQVTDLRGLHAPDVKLSPLGEIKVGTTQATGVRVSRKGYRDVNLYFDKDKALLLKSETRGKDPMSGEEFTEVKLYGDYKKANGLLVPYKIDATRDGKPHTELEFTEVILAQKFPESTFAKP